MPEDRNLIETIDRIYSAAADPTQWQGTLDAIAGLYPGGHSSLIIHDLAAQSGNCAVYSGWAPQSIRSYNEYYGARNPRFSQLTGWPVGVAAISESMLDRATLFKTEFYHDFLRPLDLPDGLGVTLSRDHLRFVRLSVLYPEATAKDQDRNVQLIQRLTPHLQRAIEINRRLALANVRIEAAEGSLNRIGHGIFIVNGAGLIVFANTAAEQIVRDDDGIGISRCGQLKATSSEDSARLARLILGAANPTDGTLDRMEAILSVQRPSARRPYNLLIVPLRPSRFAVQFGEGFVAIFVSDPEGGRLPSLDLVAQSFGLTGAEMRLLGVLLAGNGLVEAAKVLKVSPHTAKTHLRSLFDKMNCSRQADVIRIVASHPTWFTRND